MWISPQFKLFLIKDYQRLKNSEESREAREWNMRRLLSKANYHIHTDAIKNYLIPISDLPAAKQRFLYADEADMLNLVVFGLTAKEWRSDRPQLAKQGFNIRDEADLIQLNVLANLESYNAMLLGENLEKKARFEKLLAMARMQFNSLMNNQKIAQRNQDELNLRKGPTPDF